MSDFTLYINNNDNSYYLKQGQNRDKRKLNRSSFCILLGKGVYIVMVGLIFGQVSQTVQKTKVKMQALQ